MYWGVISKSCNIIQNDISKQATFSTTWFQVGIFLSFCWLEFIIGYEKVLLLWFWLFSKWLILLHNGLIGWLVFWRLSKTSVKVTKMATSPLKAYHVACSYSLLYSHNAHADKFIPKHFTCSVLNNKSLFIRWK